MRHYKLPRYCGYRGIAGFGPATGCASEMVFDYPSQAAILASILPILAAQSTRPINFGDLISTPARIQKTLERCDGHPDFETALANWLETAQPQTPAERVAIHATSLRLLEDTTDRQLIFGLIDGLLRHAMEDLTRDPAIVPAELAHTLYNEIRKSVRNQRSKTQVIPVVAKWLADDGSVTNSRQAAFVLEFIKLAEPRRNTKGGALRSAL